MIKSSPVKPRQVKLDERSRSARGANGPVCTLRVPAARDERLDGRLDERSRQVKLDERSRYAHGTSGQVERTLLRVVSWSEAERVGGPLEKHQGLRRVFRLRPSLLSIPFGPLPLSKLVTSLPVLMTVLGLRS